MPRILRIIFVAAVIAISCGSVLADYSANSKPSTPDEMVWHWSSPGKNSRQMKVTVLLDNKVIYDTVISVSHLRRSEIKPEPKQRTLIFNFVAGKKRQFDTERPYVKKGQKVEGGIWEAGMENDSVLLGVSLSTGDKILLNTLHWAYINHESEVEVADGLVIRTSVINAKK